VQCEQLARILLKRRKKASTPERARARERGRNRLKQQIECDIIWIQQCSTRKKNLKFFACFPTMINILIIFPMQYFEEMLKFLFLIFLFFLI